jgi:hypothetical protein
VTTETFDASGKSTGSSTTETRTTLKEVGSDGFVLLVESTTDYSGKRIIAPPMPVPQRFDGLPSGKTATLRQLGSESVSIEGRFFPCQVQQFEVSTSTSRTLTKTFYCDAAAPYVLRRESSTTDLASRAVTGHSLVEVVALDMPYKVRNETHSTAHVRIVEKHAKGTEVTLAVYSMDVPGSVVSHSSKEVDAAGHVTSRSTLELLDFEVREDSSTPRDSRRVRRLPRLLHRSGGRGRPPITLQAAQ